jgi:hypothetical protein
LIIFDRRIADFHAQSLLEGIGHGAADQKLVALLEQGLDDFDLIGNLEAAEDGDIRTITRSDGRTW